MNQHIRTSVGPLAIMLLQAAPIMAAPGVVDFRNAPPEWQTAICLPDDPHKSLVDRSGELLYHYRQHEREFDTRVGVEVVGNAVWQKQELLSPRVPIVRTFRTADGLEIVEEAFAVNPEGPVRSDLILVHVTNTSGESRTLRPRLIVDTKLEFSLQQEVQSCLVNKHETITTSPKMISVLQRDGL